MFYRISGRGFVLYFVFVMIFDVNPQHEHPRRVDEEQKQKALPFLSLYCSGCCALAGG